MRTQWVSILTTAFLMLLSSCIFFAPSRAHKKFVKAQKKAPYDAIIVPGVPFDSSYGKWSDIMKLRVYWSHYLYTQGIAKNVIYSGSAVYTPYMESKIMALYAEQLGIPKEHIFVDTSAEHSTENIYYSYYIAQRQGFKKIAVATDPFQSYLLRRFPKKIKVQVDFIPAVFKTMGQIEMRDPTIQAELCKMDPFIALPVRESFWKRFRGTLGKNIKPDPEDPRFATRISSEKEKGTH